MSTSGKSQLAGAGLALLAVMIWSGNFIVARAVIHDIQPFSLAFFRWLCAAVCILPFSFKKIYEERTVIIASWKYLFWTALFGITLFNTFVYIGGHYTTAINLALIGTTSSPIIAIILARIFLKEEIGLLKFAGVLLCVAGVLFLLSRGDWHNLVNFHFGTGDKWVLLGAACFAVYNILTRKKPPGISANSFLGIIFSVGTILLIPFYIWDVLHAPPVQWSANLVYIILFLGVGSSVISYLLWNSAIEKLGAGRTAIFGNLLIIFSSIEAALILHEAFTWVHVVGMVLVFSGILLANWKMFRK
ncbi:EamA/RhaT family transporter [Terrimonas sp.]|uniref:DMT family transporter n=1 Tax=Terrimonas sp. TaxID=1914338 RepID=UPI000D510495|nr:DMT family transporter [Terrimonas sp.]PVD53235.1 EamA/RhaT family transporter [Terrimonas sp.]